MAYIHEIDCPKCGQTKTEVKNVYGMCNDCVVKEKSAHKRMHLASLQGLTIEERMIRIEEQLYDLSLNPPWESKHHTYT
jgi:hypothetical protein